MVEPVSPFQGSQFQCLPGFPGSTLMDEFCLVESIDGFSEGIVIAIPAWVRRSV